MESKDKQSEDIVEREGGNSDNQQQLRKVYPSPQIIPKL
jgi:hypothetical protein